MSRTWSRTSHAQSTVDVRNQTGMQQISSFLFCCFLWLLSDIRGVEREISQNLHQIVELISRIEGLLQSWSSTPLQVPSVREASKFVEAKVDSWIRQVDIVKETLSKCRLNPEQPADPHAVTVFLFLFLWPYKPHLIRSRTRIEAALSPNFSYT